MVAVGVAFWLSLMRACVRTHAAEPTELKSKCHAGACQIAMSQRAGASPITHLGRATPGSGTVTVASRADHGNPPGRDANSDRLPLIWYLLLWPVF